MFKQCLRSIHDKLLKALELVCSKVWHRVHFYIIGCGPKSNTSLHFTKTLWNWRFPTTLGCSLNIMKCRKWGNTLCQKWVFEILQEFVEFTTHWLKLSQSICKVMSRLWVVIQVDQVYLLQHKVDTLLLLICAMENSIFDMSCDNQMCVYGPFNKLCGRINNSLTILFMYKLEYGPFLFFMTLVCIFSRINFVCMPHEGWMKNGSLFAQKFVT